MPHTRSAAHNFGFLCFATARVQFSGLQFEFNSVSIELQEMKSTACIAYRDPNSRQPDAKWKRVSMGVWNVLK